MNEVHFTRYTLWRNIGSRYQFSVERVEHQEPYTSGSRLEKRKADKMNVTKNNARTFCVTPFPLTEVT
jgi:hypothetical protein